MGLPVPLSDIFDSFLFGGKRLKKGDLVPGDTRAGSHLRAVPVLSGALEGTGWIGHSGWVG